MTHRFDTLDALRAVAAILVLAMHSGAVLSEIVPGGHLAVPFFFVLSGFIVAHAYEDRLRTDMSFVAFAKVRLIRLWPLYAIGTVVGILLFLDTILWKRAFLVSLALAPLVLPAAHPRISADHASQFPFNIPAWSLFLELLVNAIYALILPYLNRLLLIAILVGGAAGVIAVEMFDSFEDAPNDTGLPSGLAQVAYCFFAGVAVFRLWRARPPKWSLPLIAAVPLLVLSAMFPVDLFWCLVGFPALVYLTANTMLKGATRTVAQQLGAASYAIYILQWPMLVLATKLGLEPESPWRILLVPAIIAGGVVAERFVERPLRRWLTKVLSGAGAIRPAGTPAETTP